MTLGEAAETIEKSLRTVGRASSKGSRFEAARVALLVLSALFVGIVIGWKGGETFTYESSSEEEMFREWETREAEAAVGMAVEWRSHFLTVSSRRVHFVSHRARTGTACKPSPKLALVSPS
jgi:hypothetical protein